ncbi:MAG: hypothetical protein JW993_10340 [Sedimentisphaerales bacterium]|nr:hypothetical protein [Sedimentisphaerales bacterium]
MIRCRSRTRFTFDLTDDQRQLCTWVAEQARLGVNRIGYADAKTALDIKDDTDITRILRQMRERRDDLHRMVHSPIVNTARPYFDVHRDADCIWDDYCQAELEEFGADFAGQDSNELRGLCISARERTACAV